MNENNATVIEEGEVEEITPHELTIAAVDRVAIDAQVATAKSYPRNIRRFRDEARSLALLDEETAGECFYALPRSGKTIEGPSARLAEIVVYAWGNCRADADIVDTDRTHVTAMGTCFDLEKNVAVRVRVKRRITDKRGKRYNEDMIGVTSNAAISIALRNAVFKVIPKALWKPIYEEARRASLGEGGTLQQKRQQMVDWYAKLGVSEDELVAAVGREGGIADISIDDLITLRGLANAIKDGETSVEDAFARGREIEEGALTERVKAMAEEAAPEKHQPTVDELKAKADAKKKAASSPQEAGL